MKLQLCIIIIYYGACIYPYQIRRYIWIWIYCSIKGIFQFLHFIFSITLKIKK